MIYTIYQNKHYSNNSLYKIINFLNIKNSLSYLVMFDSSCEYKLSKSDQEDINKLFGFSLGFNHHKDSARFGWFYDDGTIHLYWYVYDNGIRKYGIIKNLDLNTRYELTIKSDTNNWHFSVVDDYSKTKTDVKVVKSSEFKIGYKLWPYFGGNNPAPHDIKIEMI